MKLLLSMAVLGISAATGSAYAENCQVKNLECHAPGQRGAVGLQICVQRGLENYTFSAGDGTFFQIEYKNDQDITATGSNPQRPMAPQSFYKCTAN